MASILVSQMPMRFQLANVRVTFKDEGRRFWATAGERCPTGANGESTSATKPLRASQRGRSRGQRCAGFAIEAHAYVAFLSGWREQAAMASARSIVSRP